MKVINKPEQIKTDGKQLMSIPNNEEGKAFYKLFRRYFNNKKYHVHKHGRGGGRGQTFRRYYAFQKHMVRCLPR